MVDQIRKTPALRERLAEMAARITLEYLADDDQSADALRRKLRERSEPTVRPLPVGDLRFHLSAALPVPPDVARNGWYDWIARTTTVPGCRLIGWGCDFEEP